MVFKSFTHEDGVREMCKNLYNLDNLTEEETLVLNDPDKVAMILLDPLSYLIHADMENESPEKTKTILNTNGLVDNHNQASYNFELELLSRTPSVLSLVEDQRHAFHIE